MQTKSIAVFSATFLCNSLLFAVAKCKIEVDNHQKVNIQCKCGTLARWSRLVLAHGEI